MLCSSCGSENTGGIRFCGACGERLNGSSSQGEAAYGQYMPFATAVAKCLSKPFFRGRASRSEYWWFYLFLSLLSWGAEIVDSVIVGWQLVSVICAVAMIPPSITSTVRRLHDTNRSGYWCLIFFTLVGIPILVYWLCSKSDSIENDYG
jgi:uncharacterized membrane protein YhaH (DUF805 family)